ncbi:hypothetical protein PVT68_12525 [Microbulbifer bruguierae]|uniref:Glycerophosphoryl diester phosphodiesterase membrane domain-containing protein n=1 Tax=Microbulbifer bruguierae TaxID=3029061 RepID=A0ABY8N9N2_9GAMM|nr:hypothetical protein [Microbulbifer bruguierae]WGL15593.1 hypothetical protein PVT68_12525 [Microbulbifer bruguierae]
MSDIYSAPQADLSGDESSSANMGSIPKALAGDYQVAIGNTLSEAWARTKGKKGTVWLGVLLYTIAYLAISFVIALITGQSITDPDANQGLTAVLANILTVAVTAPLTAGMMMIGIKIARDEEVSGTEVFAHFDKILPLAVGVVLMYVLISVGVLLLVLPGIYLMIGYVLMMPLIVDKNLGPWQALETSRKAVTKHWFPIFGFMIVLMLLYVAGFLALLIGLIWAIPALSIAYGVLYRNMFGGHEINPEL